MRKQTELPDAQRLLDEVLVLGIRTGDRLAAEHLARRWRPRLMRTARRLLGDTDQIQDVVQESWVSIARSLPRLRDPARFAPWAYGILQRRCIDLLRRQYREGDSTETLHDADGAVVVSNAERSDISSAFETLPYPLRVTATLFYSEGLTLHEISHATAVPVGTAKSRLFYARKQLRHYLDGES